MNKTIKIICILVIIVCAIIGGYLGYAKFFKEDKVIATTSVNNTNSNTSMELVEEVNNVVENKVENTVVNENEVVESESTKKEEPKTVKEPAKQEIKSNNESEVESEDDEQKAINIVKKDWGSDEGVVFTLESISSNGNYIISVRDTESRNAVAWYTVNPKTGEFSN